MCLVLPLFSSCKQAIRAGDDKQVCTGDIFILVRARDSGFLNIYIVFFMLYVKVMFVYFSLVGLELLFPRRYSVMLKWSVSELRDLLYRIVLIWSAVVFPHILRRNVHNHIYTLKNNCSLCWTFNLIAPFSPMTRPGIANGSRQHQNSKLLYLSFIFNKRLLRLTWCGSCIIVSPIYWAIMICYLCITL